jgi:hypothetical protein
LIQARAVRTILSVSVDLHPPDTEVISTPPPQRRPRRRGWWIAAVVGIVVVGLVAGGLYLTRYEPLVVDGSATSGQYVDNQHTDLDGDLQAFVYHDGGLILEGLSIRNSGRVPITITGVEQSPGGWVGLITVEEPRLGAESNPSSLAASQPFHPFTLAHEQDQWLDVAFRMGHCANFDPGTSMNTTAVSVLFTALGVHRSQQLTLAPGIWVNAPPAGACPARSG